MSNRIQIVTNPSELLESPPTTSHVKRIILEFEDRRFLPLPAPQVSDCGLYEGQNHVLSVRSRMMPVHRLPEVTITSEETMDGGYCDPDYDESELPEHVENEMLKRHHSLVFECNWWLEGENMQAEAKPNKLSLKERVKRFFLSMFCCSCKCR